MLSIFHNLPGVLNLVGIILIQKDFLGVFKNVFFLALSRKYKHQFLDIKFIFRLKALK